MARLGKRALDEEMHQKMVDLARAGNYKATIARACGIHPDTLHGWLRQGREQPEEYPHYAALHEEIEEAEAEWEAQTVAQINTTAQSGAPNTWQAGMTMLERKFPDRWGRRDSHKIEADKPLVQIGAVVLVDADARRDTRSLLRRVTGSGADLALGTGMGDEHPDVIDAEPIDSDESVAER